MCRQRFDLIIDEFVFCRFQAVLHVYNELSNVEKGWILCGFAFELRNRWLFRFDRLLLRFVKRLDVQLQLVCSISTSEEIENYWNLESEVWSMLMIACWEKSFWNEHRCIVVDIWERKKRIKKQNKDMKWWNTNPL